MLNRVFLYSGLFLFLVTLYFYFFPELDLYISGLYFDREIGFIYKDNIINKFIFKYTMKFAAIYSVALILHIIYKIYNSDINLLDISITNLIVIIIASGLIVHVVLKDNFGRPRPVIVREFKGIKKFTPVYVFSDRCYKNCSFPSGHAAAAFNTSLIAYYFAYPYNFIAFSLSIVFSILVGSTRVLQGGHFPSDIFVSGVLVYLTAFVCHEYIRPVIRSYFNQKYNKKEELDEPPFDNNDFFEK